MSNPAVITLASIFNASPNLSRLVIEDNIGESIHIHWNNYRFDLSIQEFLELAGYLSSAEQMYWDHLGINLGHLDPSFQFRMANLLADITDVTYKKVPLSSLSVILAFQIPRLGLINLKRHLRHSPFYKYFSVRSDRINNYIQDSKPGLSNEQRLINIQHSISTNGYPFRDDYITLFGDQLVIRDGMHRASVLAATDGFNSTPITRIIHFSGSKWRSYPLGRSFAALAYGNLRKLYKRLAAFLSFTKVYVEVYLTR